MIDIETVPQVPDFNQLSSQWQSLFIDKISKTMPENLSIEECYRMKGGILAEFAKVICITTGFFYNDKAGNLCLKLKSIYGDDECDVITRFCDIVKKFEQKNRQFKFVGHNIREFDIPFLCRRMLINGIPLAPAFQIQGAKPWEVNMIDTLQWWKFGDYKNYISLHLLASVLGIPTSKSDIDGSMVQDVYYIEGDLLRIVDYCQRDVTVVARILQRFKGMSPIADDYVFISQ